MRHTFRETWSGLRRNLSMTLSVIVTMWVSLALFGAGLMTTQQVDLIKGRWYDKIEISVFLCVDESTGGTCTTGQATTQPQKDAIRKALENHPQVQVPVYYESKAEAYADFKEAYSDSPVLETLSESQMQDSFRIKLRNPQEYQDVVTMVLAMPGVQAFPSEGNMILVRVPDATRAFEGMRARGVLIKNVSKMHPLLANCVRLTVGTTDENTQMLAALQASL